MIPILRLHYQLDLKLNKLASNEHQQINPEDKDLALHENTLRLIKGKLGANNLYGIGMDGFRKRYQDLEGLVVPHETLTPVPTTDRIPAYAADLSKLAHPFFLPVDSYTACSRDACTDRTVWIENIAPHSDLPMFLNAPDRQPSFAYQVTFAVISSGKMLIYGQDPDGPFSVDALYLSYLRHPRRVCLGTYPDFDGIIQPRQDCELPEHLEDELLDLTVESLALSTENQFAAQAAQARAKTGE